MLLRALTSGYERGAGRLRAARSNATVRAIVSAIGEPWSFMAIQAIATLNDVDVALLIAPGTLVPAAVVKVARSAQASRSLERHRVALGILAGLEVPGDWRMTVPAVGAHGSFSGRLYLVESAVDGIPAASTAPGRETVVDRHVIEATVQSISALHRATAREVVVGDERLGRWVDDPAGRVRTVVNRPSDLVRLDRLVDEMRADLVGRRVIVSRVHGDLTVDNVYLTSDGRQVTGLVDWEASADDELPELDLVLFALTARIRSGQRLGDLLSLGLGDGAAADDLLQLPSVDPALYDNGLSTRTRLLLTFVRQAAANIEKSVRYQGRSHWARRNVVAVIRAADPSSS